MTPERKLKKVVINLMRTTTFADFSGILMLGTKTVVDGIGTACTDGRDELYDRKFIEELSEKMLAFVILHEGAHKLLRQLTIWRKLFDIDPDCANRAADFVINLMIFNRDPQELYIEVPKKNGKPFICLDQRFTNMNTKQVFDILRAEKKEREKGGRGGKPGEPGGVQGQGEGSEQFDKHDWDGAKKLTKEERDELDRQIDQAVRQGQITAQKIAGKNGGTMNRELQDLLDPKVDWRDLLRDFVSQTCKGKDYSSWRRPNRRYLSQGIIMPSLVGERVENLVVGCDTSGSIGNTEHARNLTETDEIIATVSPDKLHLIYWDHRVAGHEVYDDSNRESFRTSTKPRGGGGTDPRCMERYLEKEKIKPDCIIMFTDGCISSGQWGTWDGIPILWVIVGSYGRSIMAPCGQTIHVDL